MTDFWFASLTTSLRCAPAALLAFVACLLVVLAPSTSTAAPLVTMSGEASTSTRVVAVDFPVDEDSAFDPPKSPPAPITDAQWLSSLSTGAATFVAGTMVTGPVMFAAYITWGVVLVGLAVAALPGATVVAPVVFAALVAPVTTAVAAGTAGWVFDDNGFAAAGGAFGGALAGATVGSLVGLGLGAGAIHGVLGPLMPPPDPDAGAESGLGVFIVPGTIFIVTGIVGASLGAGIGAGWATLANGEAE